MEQQQINDTRIQAIRDGRAFRRRHYRERRRIIRSLTNSIQFDTRHAAFVEKLSEDLADVYLKQAQYVQCMTEHYFNNPLYSYSASRGGYRGRIGVHRGFGDIHRGTRRCLRGSRGSYRGARGSHRGAIAIQQGFGDFHRGINRGQRGGRGGYRGGGDHRGAMGDLGHFNDSYLCTTNELVEVESSNYCSPYANCSYSTEASSSTMEWSEEAVRMGEQDVPLTDI